jgi:hypothetical protein
MSKRKNDDVDDEEEISTIEDSSSVCSDSNDEDEHEMGFSGEEEEANQIIDLLDEECKIEDAKQKSLTEKKANTIDITTPQYTFGGLIDMKRKELDNVISEVTKSSTERAGQKDNHSNVENTQKLKALLHMPPKSFVMFWYKELMNPVRLMTELQMDTNNNNKKNTKKQKVDTKLVVEKPWTKVNPTVRKMITSLLGLQLKDSDILKIAKMLYSIDRTCQCFLSK